MGNVYEFVLSLWCWVLQPPWRVQLLLQVHRISRLSLDLLYLHISSFTYNSNMQYLKKKKKLCA